MALVAVAQIGMTYFLYSIPNDWILPCFLFFSTLFTYNFLRIIKLKNIEPENHSEQLVWIGHHLKIITWMMILSFIGCGVLFLLLSHHQQALILISGIFAIGYNIPLRKNGLTLRKIAYFKSIWISLVWTIFTFLLPLSEKEFVFPVQEFIQRFLFFYVITIPFDIRDLKYDDPKMKTSPQLLGKTGAIFFGIILLITCLCLAFDIHTDKIALHFTMSYILTGILLLVSWKDRKELFYPILIDGILILQPILVIAAILIEK